MNRHSNTDERGTFAYENWKLALADVPVKLVVEYPLYTDAHILGGELRSESPYFFINTINVYKPAIEPSIILRLEYYLEQNDSVPLKTDIGRFHGGNINDELTALLSLCLGVRLKSGAYNRCFDPDGDPKGQPVYYNIDETPSLLKTTSRPVLPQALGEHNLSDASLIESFYKVSPSASIALIRAARLYQDALWIVESEPQLSWVMLVSAVEAAANYWRSKKDSALEKMREFDPTLEPLLMDAGGDTLTLTVANKIESFLGSTKKFKDFLIEFLPPPPAKRPEKVFQHSWEQDDIKKTLSVIYKGRSNALHSGIPFPVPMCGSPLELEEIPIGLASSAKGGVWSKKDAPILLHTFEHIVRGCLLNWWRSTVS